MEASPAVFDIDLRTFAQDVVERSKHVPVVVLFWTDQVPPSVDTRQALERLSGQYQGKFALGLSDIAKDQALAQQLRVQGIPAIRVIKDGQLAEQMEGPQGESVLRELIDRLTMSSGDVLKQSLARHLEREDWDAALATLQQAIDEEPNNPAFKVEWADILAIQGDVEGADTVLATIPDDAAERERPATRLQIAEEASGMGDLQAALAGVTANETDLEARYRAAILLAQARRYEEALEQAMTILATDRDFREDAGRVTMVRIMTLLGKGSEIATRYRRRMFNFMH